MVLAPNIVVRRFVAKDADSVSALIRNTLLTSNVADYPVEEMEALADWYSAAGLISRLPLAHRIVAVAEGSDRVVGTGARLENRLEAFFVAPGWQGRGIGVQLLAALEEDAVAHGLRVLWLDSSLTAVGFYTKQGYVAASEPCDHGDGVVVPMRKSLEPPRHS